MKFIFGVTPRASAWLGSAHALEFRNLKFVILNRNRTMIVTVQTMFIYYY